jgi:hypothetical protein
MRFATSRYAFVRDAIVKGTRWLWGALAASTAIIGGTIAGYAHFAANRPLVVALGAVALFLLILEALYREYGADSQTVQRARLLRMLADISERGHRIPFPDSEPRVYGGWSTWAHRQIASVDVAYAAEFNSVADDLPVRLRKIQDIMRGARSPGSHIGPGDGSYEA